MLVNILFFILTYLMIGRVIHSHAQPIVSKKSFGNFTKQDLTTYILDVVFWFPLLIVFIIFKINKHFIK